MSWRQDVAKHDIQLEIIERELASLRARQALLHSEQARLRHTRFAIIAAHAPWRRLPSELLAMIFVMLNMQDEPHTLPTILSQVCTEWRDITLLTPRLWTRIKIADRRGIHTARLWFERSKSAPAVVDYSLLEEDVDIDADGDTFQGALSLIVSHIHHIIDLRIKVASGAQCNEVVAALNRPAPIIYVFHLQGTYDNADSYFVRNHFAKSIFGESAPNLHSLRIISPHSQWSCMLMQNLTDLVLETIGEATLPSLLQLLGSTSCLTSLKVLDFMGANDHGGRWPFEALGIMITLPALVHIHFEGTMSCRLFLLLECLDTPRLRFIYFGYQMEDINDDLRPIPSLDLPPFPALEFLQISGQSTEPPTVLLARLLRRCNNVKRWHVCNSPTPLLASLSITETTFFPNLVHLRVVNLEVDIDPIHHPLGRFLVRRANEKTPIEILSFRGPFSCSEEMAAKYRGMVKIVEYKGGIIQV